ncbi:apolipoprotein N-acyltransferase [Deinococcus ruber]|uniref:Apolipoprotein N-acyltransferase n=1 Tax=Deinococcus ruber TaxID=1848197 RepID=A0A918CGP8_9DEIO|nr:apolipoprotein N-acyltransferase [Deinococcus ruber]GGR21014.1 apolipoprotein N-acyltransferase [Deinococcus ruber]
MRRAHARTQVWRTERPVGFRRWRERLGMRTAAPFWGFPLVLGMLSGLALLSALGAPVLTLTLSVVLASVQARAPARAAQWMFAFALGFYGAHLQWLFTSLNRILGEPAGMLVVPLVVLLAGGLTGVVWLTRRLSGRWLLLALPAAWILFDWGRTLGPLGFPWGSVGYAASRTPALQLASVGGVPLLAGVMLGSAALLAHRTRWSISMAGMLWGLALLLGVLLTAPTPAATRTALLVQGSIDPRAKFRGTVDASRLYRDLTRSARLLRPADVVLWPETALPVLPADLARWPNLSLPGVPLITGAADQQPGAVYNSAVALSDAGVFRYDKVRTVPFGETFPGWASLGWLYRPVLAALGVPELRNVTPGTRAAVLRAGALRYAVSICYESVFPGLARRAVRDGAQVLVTLSNDAWFGQSAGAEQHFQMGRVRAVETRRSWLRAGNDGVTAVTDPYGRVQARLARGVRGTLQAGFTPLGSLSVYVRFGDWMVALAAVALLNCCLQGDRMKRVHR